MMMRQTQLGKYMHTQAHALTSRSYRHTPLRYIKDGELLEKVGREEVLHAAVLLRGVSQDEDDWTAVAPLVVFPVGTPRGRNMNAIRIINSMS